MRTSLRLHLLSALGLAGMLALAAGSQKPTPEREKAAAEERAAAKVIVQNYVKKMSAVYTNLKGRNAAPLRTACDEALLLRNVPPRANAYESIEVTRYFGPYLARFASTDPAVWKKAEGPFAWLTDDSFFDRHPDTLPGYDTSVALHVQTVLVPRRYALVLWPTDEARNRMPRVADGSDGFVGGRFEGVAYLVDVVENTIACQTPLLVVSSAKVNYRDRGMFPEKAQSALDTDFENAMKDALEAFLPKHVRFGTMGSIF